MQRKIGRICTLQININRPKKLKSIASGEDIAEFRNFSNFIFKYHMLKPGQRTLDLESACVLIPTVLGKKYKIANKFIEYIKKANKKAITRDQWDNMIDVFEILEKQDKYDINGACNTLPYTQGQLSLTSSMNG